LRRGGVSSNLGSSVLQIMFQLEERIGTKRYSR
jgi:hypothetical protein